MKKIEEERKALNEISKKAILMRACLICRNCDICEAPEDEDDCDCCPIAGAIKLLKKEEE